MNPSIPSMRVVEIPLWACDLAPGESAIGANSHAFGKTRTGRSSTKFRQVNVFTGTTFRPVRFFRHLWQTLASLIIEEWNGRNYI